MQSKRQGEEGGEEGATPELGLNLPLLQGRLLLEDLGGESEERVAGRGRMRGENGGCGGSNVKGESCLRAGHRGVGRGRGRGPKVS